MIPRISTTNPSDMLSTTFFNAPNYVGKTGYYAGNTNYQCVSYAIGRQCEISQRTVTYYSGISTKSQIEKPMFNRSGYGNAKNWWTDTLWQKGSEAKVGAVMVYGSNYGGGYGHVRVVEKIENGKIFYSAGNESGKMAFKWINIPKVSANNFLGYIYNPYLDTSNPALAQQIVNLEGQILKLRATLTERDKEITSLNSSLKEAEDKLDKIKAIL